MATFLVVEGQPGQGKSLWTARLTRKLLIRNKRWYEKQYKEYELLRESWKRSEELRSISGKGDSAGDSPTVPPQRRIASNIKFTQAFEEEWEGWIIYWTTLDELHKLRHVDIIWDEIATELDNRNWVLLADETKRMLSQYRKRGLDIYSNTQDFSMIDQRARLMINSVSTLRKVIGSRDPSTTKPIVKRVWGVILIRGVQNFKETDIQKKVYSFFDWSFMLIEKELVDIYDTTQDIPQGAPAPWKHTVRYCELHGKDCDFVKTLHS